LRRDAAVTQARRSHAAGAVRCPKCGALNPDPPGAGRGARCRACHEAFTKCRYCRHYAPDVVDCTNVHRAEHDHVIDADEVVNCPEFRSLLTSEGRRRAWYGPVRTFAITAALTLAAALGAIHWAGGPKRVPVTLPVSVSVSAPEMAMKEDGLDVTASVFNPTDRPAEGVEILITGRSLPWLICQSTNPPEAYLDSGGHSVSASFGDVPPGEQRIILFHFAPSRTGEVSLTANVTMKHVLGSSTESLESEIVP